MRIIDEMQLYYDQRASIYDKSMGYNNPDKVINLKPVIDFIGTEVKNRTVFEVACGPGFWTQQISQFAQKILATDFNQSPLDQAITKKLSPNLVSFQQADAYNLAKIEDKFDAAMGIDWLSHVPKSKMDYFLQGVHNVLKPEAKVIFCDELQGDFSVTTGIFDSEGNYIQERNLPNGTKHRVIKNYMTREEIREILSPYANEIKITKFVLQPTNKWSYGRIVITYYLK